MRELICKFFHREWHADITTTGYRCVKCERRWWIINGKMFR